MGEEGQREMCGFEGHGYVCYTLCYIVLHIVMYTTVVLEGHAGTGYSTVQC